LGVRVHTGPEAIQMNRELGAQAFAVGQDIYYGAEQSPSDLALTAHELTHVVQQTGAAPPQTKGDGETKLRRAKRAGSRSVQRLVEVRPPGRGEASAFERRQELVDRLNLQSRAIQYNLDARRLRYAAVDEANLTNFDRQMRGFIDGASVLPL